MLKTLKGKMLISLLLGISFGMGAFVSYAADLTLVSDVPTSGAVLTVSWFSDLRDRIINITGNGGNVGIGVPVPTTKLDVNGNIRATGIKVSCIGNCF